MDNDTPMTPDDASRAAPPSLTLLQGGNDPLAAGLDLGAPPEELVPAAVARYLEYFSVACDLRTEGWRREGISYSSRSLAEDVWGYFPRAPLKLFEVHLARQARDRRLEGVREVARRLGGAGRSGEERGGAALQQFVSLLAHKDTPADRLAYYVSAWRQLIWQVKRRMAGKRTSSEVMLVLSGPQGSGKSTALEAFAAPLSFLCVPDGTFRIFSDPFRLAIVERSFLIVLDEMERGDATDIESVKRTMTAPYLQARGMHSQREVGYLRNASFIGATNLPLAAHVRDSTGMRRFVEMRFRDGRADAAFRQELLEVDMAAVWASADASEETPPLVADGTAVEAFQAELVTKSAFDSWFEECVERLPGNSEATVRRKEMFASFVEWCETNRETGLGRNIFYRQLTAAGLWKSRTMGEEVCRGVRLHAV